LTEDERSRLLARLASDSDAGKREQFSWAYVYQAIADPLVWGYAFLFHGFAFVLYTLSLFSVRCKFMTYRCVDEDADALTLDEQPTIIANLGFATWKAQLYVFP
jgi:hypothetical protein